MVATLAAIATAAAVPGGLPAQEHLVEITPSVANGFFGGTVLEIRSPDGTVLHSSVEDALAGGLTIGVRPVERFVVELEVTRAFSTESSISGGPSVPLTIDVATGFTYYGGAVRFSLLGTKKKVDPFVVAGVGKKEFDPGITGTARPFTGNVGVGFRLRVPGWPDLRTEVRDYVSSFDPGPLVPGFEKETHVQHDVFWKIGAVFRLF